MAETRSSFGDDVRAPETRAPRRARFLAPFGKAAPRPFLKEGELAALFSVGAREDGDLSLSFLLRQSAHALERARAHVDGRGAELARVIEARSESEARLASWAARLVIGLFWVFIGVVLAREAAVGVPVRGLDAGSASLLARIFVAVGVMGSVAAFVGGYLARGAAQGVPDALGAEAGAIARGLGEKIDEIASRIGEGSPPASDVSRLHFLALEAAALFSRIGFLSESDEARAKDQFRAFLAARAPGGSASRLAALLLLLLGVVIGVAAKSGAAPSFGGAAGLPLWAVAALPGLALFYAATGVLFAAARGSAADGAERARAEVLAALRRAYAAAGAPSPDSLTEAVERALARRPARSDETGRDARASADPSWTRPAEAPRFVPQAFEAAPPSFRVDAQEGSRKNFFARRRRNAEPKQPASAPDAPP